MVTATLVQQLVTMLMSSMKVRFHPSPSSVLRCVFRRIAHECTSWLAHRLRWRCWDCQMETSHHQPKLQLQWWQTASSSCWQPMQSLQLLPLRLQVTMLQPGMIDVGQNNNQHRHAVYQTRHITAGAGAAGTVLPLTVPEACQLMHFTAAQLSAPADEPQSRRRSSRQSTDSAVQGQHGPSCTQQRRSMPLELAAYAATLAQAAVAAAPEGQDAARTPPEEASAKHRLAIAAWRVHNAAGGVRFWHHLYAGTASRLCTLVACMCNKPCCGNTSPTKAIIVCRRATVQQPAATVRCSPFMRRCRAQLAAQMVPRTRQPLQATLSRVWQWKWQSHRQRPASRHAGELFCSYCCCCFCCSFLATMHAAIRAALGTPAVPHHCAHAFCRAARTSSASSGPSVPTRLLPMAESPPETPLQMALRRPVKMHSLPPSRRITPQVVQGPARPVEAWKNLQVGGSNVMCSPCFIMVGAAAKR